jgi:hypothetical protein
MNTFYIRRNEKKKQYLRFEGENNCWFEVEIAFLKIIAAQHNKKYFF